MNKIIGSLFGAAMLVAAGGAGASRSPCVKISRKGVEFTHLQNTNCGFIGRFHLASSDAKAGSMKTKIIVLFLALAGLLPLAARAQVNYAVSGNTAYVTNSPYASGNIVIASNYNGYPVTSIGTNAFKNALNLKSVVIQNTVTSIDDYAFLNCLNLTNLVIGTNVTSIGDYTFGQCAALTKIIIPNS